MIRKLTLEAVVLLLSLVPVLGQGAKLNPFSIKSSGLIDQIKELKAANPKLTAKELDEAANLLLEKAGVGFTIMLDPATCDKIRKVKAQQKDPKAPISLGVSLLSVGAEGAKLKLPDPTLTSVNCGDCFVTLPILEMTANNFVTIVSEQNIKFHRPANFLVNEVNLVDTVDGMNVKKTWRVPFRSKPIGISYDENVLYMGFDEVELSGLSLLVFEEGVFQIGTRDEAEAGGKGVLLPGPASSPRQIIKFDRWKRSYLISFIPACDPQTR